MGDADPMGTLDTGICDSLRTPLMPGAPAVFVDDNAQDISNDLAQILVNCLGERRNSSAEQLARDVLGQCLMHFDRDPHMPVAELFAIQEGSRLSWPMPSSHVFYTAKDDVIPAAKALLSGTGTSSELFTALAFAYHPEALGFQMISEEAFEEFKTFLRQRASTLSGVLPVETMARVAQFDALTLTGLTESLLLRRDDDEAQEEGSFARYIVHELMAWCEDLHAQGRDGIASIMPFHLGELIIPRALIFVNADVHARTTSMKIAHEWQTIQQSIAAPIKVIPRQRLAQLTAQHRFTTKINAQAASARAMRTQPSMKSGAMTLRANPPTPLDLMRHIVRVLRRMKTVNRSRNIYRTAKKTFLKANRREPDDVNRPGTILAHRYLPDLHMFVDCSGSITERDYQSAVMMLIRLAHRMDVDLYFSSFSHELSQETLLHVKGRSIQQVWQEFRRIPKVSGYTDYQQIWRYVGASKARRQRLSIIITDFEWTAPPTREEHPANLYYAPCSNLDWQRVRHAVQNFASSMQHIDPSIGQRLLGITV